VDKLQLRSMNLNKQRFNSSKCYFFREALNIRSQVGTSVKIIACSWPTIAVTVKYLEVRSFTSRALNAFYTLLIECQLISYTYFRSKASRSTRLKVSLLSVSSIKIIVNVSQNKAKLDTVLNAFTTD
jgi:hypothetical protein